MYTVEDFICLIGDVSIRGFKNEDSLREFALMLFYDYHSNRADAYQYLDNLMGATARTAFEVRKSYILGLSDSFYRNHPFNNPDAVKDYRSAFLEQIFVDYRDYNWQYWWVVKLLIPDSKKDNLEWVYERFVSDGDPQKDVFENPIINFANRIVYNAEPIK